MFTSVLVYVCDSPEPSINANETFDKSANNNSLYVLGTTLTHNCLAGHYMFAGSAERTCVVPVTSGEGGTWTGKPAVCLPIGHYILSTNLALSNVLQN